MANVSAVLKLLALRRNLNPSDSESSSDSSDDEYAEILRYCGKPRTRPRTSIFLKRLQTYTDDEFKSCFRVSRDTFKFLHETLWKDLIRLVKGCPAIPSHIQLMIALRKMTSVDSYQTICDRFNVGRATAVRAVRRVMRALFVRAPVFIQWPEGKRAQAIMQDFEEISQIPGIIGAIDGVYFRIIAPKENASEYVNDKGHHSIHLQVVCDNKMLITHCSTGYPGSFSDQKALCESEVYDFLSDSTKFPEDSHLAGDDAYDLHCHLLTPVDDSVLTLKQINYNYCLSDAKLAVDKCVGLLKARMTSLLDRLPLARLDLMAEYIVACCVVHNVCILKNDGLTVITIPPKEEEPNTVTSSKVAHKLVDFKAVQKRNNIIKNLQ